MKKLLTILGTLALGASSTATVVACGSSNGNSNVSEQAIQKIDANFIKNLITNTKLVLNWNSKLSGVAASDQTATQAIKAALKAANNELSDNELADITFNNVQLNDYKVASVTATIQTTGETATVALQISTDYTASDLISKINNTIIGLPANSNPDTSKSMAIIKTALQKANPLLSAEDLTHITIPKKVLDNKTFARTVVTSQVSLTNAQQIQSSGNMPLRLVMHRTAQEIKNIIQPPKQASPTNVVVSATAGPKASAAFYAIKASLQKHFPSLTEYALNAMTVSKDANLQTGKAVPVQLTIKDDGAQPTSVNIGINVTAINDAQTIAAKITNPNVVLASSVGNLLDPNTALDQIKSHLIAQNPQLTATDLKTVSLAKTPVQYNPQEKTTPVVMTITADDKTTAQVTLQLMISPTANQIANKIINPNLKVTLDKSVTKVSQITDLKTVLQKANPTLTAYDLTKLSFTDQAIKAGNNNIVVIAKVENVPPNQPIEAPTSLVLNVTYNK